MKRKEKEFIREIVASDFMQISNPDFTDETLRKKAELDRQKTNCTFKGDKKFLVPAVAFALLEMLFFIISVVYSWFPLNQIASFIEIISNLLMHPVMLSIMFSFSILYVLDLFFKKTLR